MKKNNAIYNNNNINVYDKSTLEGTLYEENAIKFHAQ